MSILSTNQQARLLNTYTSEKQFHAKIRQYKYLNEVKNMQKLTIETQCTYCQVQI